MKTANCITPSQHEKNEWARLAQWAYANDRNDLGHKFSRAASLRNADRMDVEIFDEYQTIYRQWLINGTVKVKSNYARHSAGLCDG